MLLAHTHYMRFLTYIEAKGKCMNMNPSYPVYPYIDTVQQSVTISATFPPQHQNRQPGIERLMDPLPIFDNPGYTGNGKLKGKAAIITGGDSGIH
jgi:hypothetical protein